MIPIDDPACDTLPNPPIHLIGDKRMTGGGEPVDATVPLLDALRDQYQDDVHFTMYTTPENTRRRKMPNTPGFWTTGNAITFPVCAYDLDMAGHTAATPATWASLLPVITGLAPRPNVIYGTEHGARLLYVLDPIHDADIFEGHYQGLMNVLGKTCFAPYELDTKTKDWPRFFRCPRVVRNGNQQQWDYPVLLLHTGLLNLRDFEPPKIERGPTTRITGKLPQGILARRYKNAATWINDADPAISGSGGHNQTFYTACRLVDPAWFGLDLDQAMDLMRVYNQKCDPEWADHELEHKLNDAWQITRG